LRVTLQLRMVPTDDQVLLVPRACVSRWSVVAGSGFRHEIGCGSVAVELVAGSLVGARSRRRPNAGVAGGARTPRARDTRECLMPTLTIGPGASARTSAGPPTRPLSWPL
jgi:hypothetical protein